MSPTIEPNEYYTSSEIAGILKISLVTVRRKLADGTIPSFKVGRQRRVLGADLLGWFSNNGNIVTENETSEVYYETDGVKLILGDSVSYMRNLEPSSIDLIFADPPYNLSNDGTTCHAGKRVSVNKGDWDKPSGFYEDHSFNKLWLSEAQKALKDSGTIFVSGTHHVIFSIGFAMQELGFKILNVITWYKPNAAPNLACRYFTHSTESIIWASPSDFQPLKHVFNYEDMKKAAGGKQMRDVWFDAWEIPTPPPAEKKYGKHPTQKPVKLVARCLLSASNESDIVLDPFCGSGTTAVAAIETRRKFIGVDLEEGYIELAIKRIKDALANKKPS